MQKTCKHECLGFNVPLHSLRRCVFPGNQLHQYRQPKTRKQKTTYTLNTKQKQKKTAQRQHRVHPGQASPQIALVCLTQTRMQPA